MPATQEYIIIFEKTKDGIFVIKLAVKMIRIIANPPMFDVGSLCTLLLSGKSINEKILEIFSDKKKNKKLENTIIK